MGEADSSIFFCEMIGCSVNLGLTYVLFEALKTAHLWKIEDRAIERIHDFVFSGKAKEAFKLVVEIMCSIRELKGEGGELFDQVVNSS